MQPRYFIGIVLPTELSTKISRLQHDLLMPGKVMPPLVPHITLLDPNSLMTLAPSYFTPKVTALAAKILPIEVNLKRVEMFDRRVLYIAAEGSDLIELQKELVGLLPDKVKAQYIIGREFSPHVTLVQAKPKQNLSEELIKSFKNKLEPLLPYRFTVNHLAQFTWQSPRNYKVEAI